MEAPNVPNRGVEGVRGEPEKVRGRGGAVDPAGDASVGEDWPERREDAEDAKLVERDQRDWGAATAGCFSSPATDEPEPEETDVDADLPAAVAAAAFGTYVRTLPCPSLV